MLCFEADCRFLSHSVYHAQGGEAQLFYTAKKQNAEEMAIYKYRDREVIEQRLRKAGAL